MRSRRWAIACGAAIGLMLLARTMAVAFVPGVFAAALAGMLLVDRTDLRRRFVNLGLTAIAAAVVAATWYYHNLKPVWEYLTSYGYGSESTYYGAQHAAVSWGRFKAVTERVIADDFLVPMTALIAIGLVALAVVVVRRLLAAEDRRQAALEMLGGEAAAIAIVVVTGVAALMTSRNGGNGFSLPISMLLPPLAVIALRYYRLATVPVAALVALIGALNLAATSTLWDGLAKSRLVYVPAYGELAWVNGSPRPVGAIRAQVPGPTTRFVDRDAGWPEADKALAGVLLRELTDTPLESGVAVFSSRNRAISSNSVQLALLLDYRTSVPFAQLEAVPDDTVANYVKQLRDREHGPPGLLITMSSEADDFPPIVTQSKAEAAARKVGFHRVWTRGLPDERQLRLWVRLARPARPAAPAPGSRRG
jgi:hypothetical protein